MSARAALSGSLDELPLTNLLPLVLKSAPNGVIELTGAASGLLVLDGGGITLALSDDGPTLQQVIIGSGIVGPEAWETAHVASMRGTPLADALIAEGADPERLEAALLEQTIAAVFGLLVPSGTDFAYLPGATHPLGPRFPFDVAVVLEQAQGRLDAWKVIAEAIPSVSIVPHLARELAGDAVTIDASDWRVLALVDGHRSIDEISRELGMSGFTVCGVLHQLLRSGVVTTT